MLLQYYKCDTSGRLKEQICPDGLVFDIPGKELSAYIDTISYAWNIMKLQENHSIGSVSISTL